MTNTERGARNTERRIALLTDFGARDPYVAAMKGVIAARTAVPIFDLSHEIAPFDVLEAAWFLRTVAAYWPEGTIFVSVVDPGVGTSRAIVLAEANGKFFLAPDNGLLTFIAPIGKPVVDESLFLPNGSTTFHGRDRFAPVAAALANGAMIEGRPMDLVKLAYESPTYGQIVRGTIVAVDRFGNVITDIEAARVPFHSFSLRVGDQMIDRLERTYADAAPGAFLIVGSSGWIEISIANGNAAERLRVERLQRVELRPQTV